MKSTVTYLFLVFLAALVFYGGAGVNLITYCCGDCRTEGVAVLLNDNCCEVHGHDCCDKSAGVSACSSDCCEDKCCDLERIDFDWDSFDKSTVELQPTEVDLFLFDYLLTSLIPISSIKECVTQGQDSPPILCPRIYLNLLTTLLI